MNILKDIPELIKAGVITQVTADNIQNYYENKGGSSSKRLFIVFGVLGAILVGLGLILIIAHNWDELARSTKTFFAFLPLLLGQLLCGFTLIKKEDSTAWKESSAAFLFFAVGASIALVGQIYNIPGNVSAFIVSWMLLCLPLIYLLKSSIASLLYLLGITYYACVNGYGAYPPVVCYEFWVLMIAALPHYYQLYKKQPKSNFIIFHNWLVPMSLVISLGTVIHNTEEFLFIAYFSLFGLFYLIGDISFFSPQKLRNNGYKIIGILGSVGLLLAFSFDFLWEHIREKDFQFKHEMYSPEFLAAIIITLLAMVLLYLQQKNKPLRDMAPLKPMFILFFISYMIGMYSSISVVLINLFVFVLGILTIWQGTRKDHLGILNYGLLIITALVICRFFDSDLNFIIRGVLFISVGVGFFTTNYWMLKKRKTNE